MSPTDSPLQVTVRVPESHLSDTTSSHSLHQSTAHTLPNQFSAEDTETQKARHRLIPDTVLCLLDRASSYNLCK